MNGLDIKEIRAHLGVTQAELAKRLGVSERTVQNWESGTTIPESKHALLRGLKPQTYFGGNVEQTNVMGNNNIQGGNAGFTAELSKLVELLEGGGWKRPASADAESHLIKADLREKHIAENLLSKVHMEHLLHEARETHKEVDKILLEWTLLVDTSHKTCQ